MAGTAFAITGGGLIPFGFIAVATPGTPVAITINIGPQTQTPNKTFTQGVRQLIISSPGTTGASPVVNTGNVYLVRKGYSRTKTNGVVAIIPIGAIQSFPDGTFYTGNLNPDDYYLDADVGTNGAFVSGVR